MEELIRAITVNAIPVILAITLHEAAHGYVARRFGDNTAYSMGRVTLNPLKHVDPIGTIVVPIAILLLSKLAGSSGFLFGWAKPVPVNFANLRNPKRDMLWVAAAGPGINLVMAFLWAAAFKLQLMAGAQEDFFFEMASAGVFINLTLMVLNLLPLPPLDGGRIAVSLLPHRLAWQYARIEPFGFPILLVLVATGALSAVLMPLVRLFGSGIVTLFFHLTLPLTAAPGRATTGAITMYPERVLSGMRPTGTMHIGHYHGALKNWVRLQDEYPCFFFVADWHALTTAYDETDIIEKSVWEMLIDWLAAGVDPAKATIFVQSRVPEHAELTVLLGMSTPLGWLERVPTYKDQIDKLSHKDLLTYGFLGYPLMQAADILIYRSNLVPVGEDQVPHIEMTREVARRFNHLYGREPGFEQKAQEAVKKLGGKRAKLYEELRKRYQEQGDADALEQGRALLADAQSLSMVDRERLFGWLEGSRKLILVEPRALLTESAKLPGLDGQKMSKSYGNAIAMREDPAVVTKKIRTMPTDPARVRRTDPGEPEKCPVWQLHLVYSDAPTREWVQTGCRTAGIGCLECKQPVIDAVLKEQEPMRERAQPYLDDPSLLRSIVAEGCDKARRAAQETMRDVREAMGLSYT